MIALRAPHFYILLNSPTNSHQKNRLKALHNSLVTHVSCLDSCCEYLSPLTINIYFIGNVKKEETKKNKKSRK